MITFLSSPKPFVGDTKLRQYRAIRSWLEENTDVEVILYGDASGIEEAGHNLGVKVIKTIACAPSGLPYFGAIAKHAARSARHDLQVYLNCDILLKGLSKACAAISLPQFLLIGQRIDLAEHVYVDVASPSWIDELRILANQDKANSHGPHYIDYFAFRRGLWADLPNVIIGRGGYDNALLAHCFRKRVPIVDGTLAVAALHQFHDYDHVRNGRAEAYFGRDALANYQTAGGRHSATLVSDADYILRGYSLFLDPCRGDKLRHFELQCRYVYGWKRGALALRGLWRLLEALGWVRRKHIALPEMIRSLSFGACLGSDLKALMARSFKRPGHDSGPFSETKTVLT